MSRSYYYLVAGLPDLVIDDAKSVPAYADMLDEITAQVCEEDRMLVDFVRHRADNANLVRLLTKNTTVAFDPAGVMDEETLAQTARFTDDLPGYMGPFVDAFREERSLFPGLTPDDQLAWLYYEEAAQSGSAFIRGYFAFEADLRNLLTAINVRTLRDSGAAAPAMEQVIVGRGDAAEVMRKSTAPDFGVGQLLPWADRVLSAPRDNLTEFEKRVDAVRWEMLGELTTFSYFGIETVLAFCVKLQIVHRWQDLDPAEGKRLLEALINELKADFHLAEEL